MGDVEMSIKTYTQMKGEEITNQEVSIDELVDVALGAKLGQDFAVNVDLQSINVDDVAPPTLKLSNAKRHISLLSSFLLENSLYFGINIIISFQKFVGSLDEDDSCLLFGLWTPISRGLENIDICVKS